MTKSTPLFALLFLFSSPVMAGTIVEIQDENELTTVMTDGKQARMNVSATEYVIVDYKNNSVKFVSHPEKQVMLLDTDGMPSGNSAPAVRTSIDKLGSGQVIAGYKTQKFSYTANGKSCGVIYGSKDAYQLKGIKELFAAMKTMVEKQRAIMGSFAGMIDACTQADMNVSDHVNTIGVPMRTEKNGRVRSEIKSIKVDVSLPADAFVIPASYKTVTMQEAMSGNMADGQMQQHQPQMQEMMRQMQQSGQMTPEMMEQMRQAQEMMRQYQQR